MSAQPDDPIKREVVDAFRYVAGRLGLGRTVDFFFEESDDYLQLGIMRADNEKEAPNEWYVDYNPRAILFSMALQDHSPREYIRSLALHEILHLIGWDLKRLGDKGLTKKDRDRLSELEESTVRMLESLLRPLIVRCQCRPKQRKRKNSSPISTPLSFIAPNPHTGSMSPSVSAEETDIPATISGNLDQSSTKLNEPAMAEDARSGTKSEA